MHSLVLFTACVTAQFSNGFAFLAPNHQKIYTGVVSTLKSSTSTEFEILKDADVIDPSSGKSCKALDGIIKKNDPASWLQGAFGNGKRKSLVVVMPQMGDFDSAEYAEMLSTVEDDLKKCKIDLRIIAIGDENSAKKLALTP